MKRIILSLTLVALTVISYAQTCQYLYADMNTSVPNTWAFTNFARNTSTSFGSIIEGTADLKSTVGFKSGSSFIVQGEQITRYGIQNPNVVFSGTYGAPASVSFKYATNIGATANLNVTVAIVSSMLSPTEQTIYSGTIRTGSGSGTWTMPVGSLNTLSGTLPAENWSIKVYVSTTSTNTNPAIYVKLDEIYLGNWCGITALNVPPTANAGSDQNITSTSTTLSGSGADSDGSVASYSWQQISGPNTVTISSSTSASTGVSGLAVGTYEFDLTVTDNLWATRTDRVVVTVTAFDNYRIITNYTNDEFLISGGQTTYLGSSSQGDLQVPSAGGDATITLEPQGGYNNTWYFIIRNSSTNAMISQTQVYANTAFQVPTVSDGVEVYFEIINFY